MYYLYSSTTYVRVGESDEPMSEYEIYSYEAFRKRIRDDIRTISNSKMQLLDEKRMKDYLDAVKNERKNLAENVSSEEIMELMGITADGTPTLAGLMTLDTQEFQLCEQSALMQVCLYQFSRLSMGNLKWLLRMGIIKKHSRYRILLWNFALRQEQERS